jgi:hypothetical protein
MPSGQRKHPIGVTTEAEFVVSERDRAVQAEQRALRAKPEARR